MWAEGVPIAVLYSALTLVLAYPLTIHPASSVLQMGADTDLFVWALGWDVHALTHRPLSLFDANIYYPYRHTLAYSENFIGSALLAAPFLWLTGNLALAMNAVALLSCVLCGLGAYVLARRVGIGPLGAALGGLIFAFAPPRFFRLGQLHLTAVQWLPFCLAFLHTYLDSGRRRDLWFACTFFTLQVLTSGHGAVFVTVSVVALVGWRAALGEPLTPAKRLRDLGVPGAPGLACRENHRRPIAQAEPSRRCNHDSGHNAHQQPDFENLGDPRPYRRGLASHTMTRLGEARPHTGGSEHKGEIARKKNGLGGLQDWRVRQQRKQKSVDVRGRRQEACRTWREEIGLAQRPSETHLPLDREIGKEDKNTDRKQKRARHAQIA